MKYVEWRQADIREADFRGHKGDQAQEGHVGARTRDTIHGPQSEYRAEGGAVGLMVELLSCHQTLSDCAPLSVYREGRKVKVLKYDQALQGLREVIREAGPKPEGFGIAFVPDWRSFYPRSRGRRIGTGYPERREVGVRCAQNVHGE